ncbi:65-kDa microtubule-associated protein 3-like isoform X2 [Aristolochia californica]|uniref:65-kDa microtubule-associated protein 3-like isoform X2 n=1 Tax=Aristolochia californica TaxID=171875 RepID=UPI0035D5B32D
MTEYFNMSNPVSAQLLQMETTCGSLLCELQIIWDEMGESDAERDKMLLELEQECLEVYRRKVDQANRSRAQLRQAIADHEAELAVICSAMGEMPVHIRQSEQNMGSLNEELKATVPQLEEMRKRKNERLLQFHEILKQIQNISREIGEPTQQMSKVDESDLSTRKLDELQKQLEALQKGKSDRLRQVLEYLKTLNLVCMVLGLDFNHIVSEVHPTLDDPNGSNNISNCTIEKLASAIQRLHEIKIQHMQKLQDLATSLLELWNLMDTPVEEQQLFQNVTCKIAASEHEIIEPGILSMDFLNHVEAEVARLEELKSSKMKELVLKKRSELEDMCRRAHMVVEIDTSIEHAIEVIDSGVVDAGYVLEQIELQIASVKEEAFSRKEILEKVGKWLVACEEESWLEEYNRDENRYNAGRGAHLTLKRAERARALVAKLPVMVEPLVSKTLAWERERGTEFTYDGVRLLTMLEEYNILRQEKEEERLRKREEKKLQGQLMAEQEVRYGSKPSPMKTPNVKRSSRPSTGNANRRLSLGGAMLQTPKFDPHPAKQSLAPQPARKGEQQLHDVSASALSPGSRGLDIVGLTALSPFNSRDNGEDTRKPCSPVFSHSSKAKMQNFQDEHLALCNTLSNGSSSLMTPISKPLSIPTKLTTVTDEENKTPKAHGIPPPTTPSTASVPMQTAMTPAPPVSVLFRSTEKENQEMGYSFEERRLGFVVPNVCIKSVHV